MIILRSIYNNTNHTKKPKKIEEKCTQKKKKRRWEKGRKKGEKRMRIRVEKRVKGEEKGRGLWTRGEKGRKVREGRNGLVARVF